jgi:hypothetical protein
VNLAPGSDYRGDLGGVRPRAGDGPGRPAHPGGQHLSIDASGASGDELAELQRLLWHGGTPRPAAGAASEEP